MSILTHIIHFCRLYIDPLTLTLLIVIRFILSNSANIISLAFLLGELLSVKKSRPIVKYNLENKNHFT